MQRLSRFRWGLTLTIILLMALTFCLSYAINRVDNAPSNNIIEAASNEEYAYSGFKYVMSYIPDQQDKNGKTETIGFGGVDGHGIVDNWSTDLIQDNEKNNATGLDKVIIDKNHTGGVDGRGSSISAGAKLYTGWQEGKNYQITDLSNFAGSAAKYTGGFVFWTGSDLKNNNNNTIYYRKDGIYQQEGYQQWVYFYGYIKLPNDLTTHGGRMTISAETLGYHDSNKGDGYKYFSVVAGDQLGNNYSPSNTEGNGYTDEQLASGQNLRASDIRMNTSTGRTNVATSIKAPDDNNGDHKVYLSDEYRSTPPDPKYKNRDTQEVTIDVRPGDKYARVSYINLFPRHIGVAIYDYYAQHIRNVNASYTLAPEMTCEQKQTTNGEANVEVNAPNSVDADGSAIIASTSTWDFRNMTRLGNGKWTYSLIAGGEYVIKVKNTNGTTSVRYINIDKEHPVIVQNSIKGNDTDSIALSRTISFEVSDANTIARVEVKLDGKPDKKIDVTPTDGYKNYSFVADEKGVYRIHMTDKYGNENVDANGNVIEGDKVTVKHILTPADENVDIKILDATNAEITFTSADYNKRIADPQKGTNVTYEKVYNYGSKAKYKATYKNLTSANVDVSATINVNTNPIALNVTINGGQAEAKNYGDTYTATADKSKLADFIGWYNERGILVSDKADYSFKVVSNTTLNAKYVENVVTSGVEVKFINISNGLVDIRRYEDDADTIIDAITKHYNDPKDNLYDFAPKNAHMNFYRWRVVSDDKATTGVRHVTVSPLYSTNDRFIVKINGSEASNPLAKSDETLKAGEFYYNQKINLTGSTNGWAIDNGDGTYEIISSGDTTFHILNNTNFVKVDSIESGTKNNVGIDSSKAKVTAENDTIVITGSIAQDIKNVKEMGFIFVSATDQNITNGNEDAYIRLNTVGVTKVQAGNLSKTNQFLVNLNAMAYTGAKKVRAYYIDEKGNEYYSDIIVIN